MSAKIQFHFVPYNLKINDLNVVLTGKSGSSLITHKALNFYTLIVKKLINNAFFDKQDSQYVFINHHERRCLLGDQYKEIIKLLVKAGYLDEDASWIYNESGKNNHTKSYALPNWMFSDQSIYKLVKISKKKSIQNMISKFNHIRLKESFCDQWREEMINTSHRMLIHDTPEARLAVQAHIDKVNSKRRFKLRLNAADMIFIFDSCALDQSLVDPFGKRVHSKISILPKTIRKFLYFDNRPDEKLGCVDIVNSQPVFMSVATPELIERFTPELEEAKEIAAKYQNHKDIKAFKEICGDGSIYEQIQGYFLSKGVMITRDQAKPICYTAFFGNYHIFELGKLKDQYKKWAYEFLQDEYNGMYKFFKEMKKHRWQENNKKIYANNCMLAQRLESQIFYTVIVPAVWEAGYRDFSTIHDSIIAPLGDLNGIHEVMKKEFEKFNIRLKLAA